MLLRENYNGTALPFLAEESGGRSTFEHVDMADAIRKNLFHLLTANLPATVV